MKRLLLALLLLSPPSSAAGAERELSVFAAASLSEAFTELGRRFEAAHPGTRVRFNFAGSQQLASQIEFGARADVFASADERWIRHVVARGLAADSGAVFARNRLVVVAPHANPARLRSPRDLGRRGVKLVLAAETVPAGAYARRMLRALETQPSYPSGFAARALANVVSNEENVRAVLGKVQLGEADAGVVYRSDVGERGRRRVRVFEIPDAANPLARYPIAVLRRSEPAGTARAFVRLVRSPAGQAVLARHGFERAP
jgi:molybdate transport system substrate-binding protein